MPIAGFKTWAADYLVQTQIEGREKIDTNRSLTFLAFGLLYSGGFQYAVNDHLDHPYRLVEHPLDSIPS